jgi:hypothetical protein
MPLDRVSTGWPIAFVVPALKVQAQRSDDFVSEDRNLRASNGRESAKTKIVRRTHSTG